MNNNDSGCLGCAVYLLLVIGVSGIVMLFIPQARFYGLIMAVFSFGIFASAFIRDGIKNEKDPNKLKKYKIAKRVVSILLILAIVVGIPTFIKVGMEDKSSSGSKSSSKTVTCGYCHRSFSEDSSDGKSIIRTHLCKNCYNNYKWGEKAIGK